VQLTDKINSFGKAMSQGDTVDYKADLKKRLSPIQYHVTQEKGTERCVLEIFYYMYKNVYYYFIKEPLLGNITKLLKLVSILV